jgi:hypothetical protein
MALSEIMSSLKTLVTGASHKYNPLPNDDENDAGRHKRLAGIWQGRNKPALKLTMVALSLAVIGYFAVALL